MPAILFGSISTIADTSELQREAFNEAFAEHDLDWQWGTEEYRSLLTANGGRGRIEDYAAQRGESVEVNAVHRTKSEIFRAKLAEAELLPRPGVAAAIEEARREGVKVALVTTTSPENVAALTAAMAAHVPMLDLDLLVDSTMVDAPKPDGAAYSFALAQLGEEASACVAVEDNVGGVQAAQAAGVRCVAFPNVNTAEHDFSAADARVETISLGDLLGQQA